VSIKLAQTRIDAIVTLDAAGAFARFGDEEFLVPTQKIEALDSTGAGDNFLAAFLVGRRQGLSVRQALAVGNVVAREVIQVQGAQLPISAISSRPQGGKLSEVVSRRSVSHSDQS
jgi:sugar/nucleoside kinase (ribokinase family)